MRLAMHVRLDHGQPIHDVRQGAISDFERILGLLLRLPEVGNIRESASTAGGGAASRPRVGTCLRSIWISSSASVLSIVAS